MRLDEYNCRCLRFVGSRQRTAARGLVRRCDATFEGDLAYAATYAHPAPWPLPGPPVVPPPAYADELDEID